MSSRPSTNSPGGLDIRPSKNLGYPILSLSSFSLQHEPTSFLDTSPKTDNEVKSGEGFNASVNVLNAPQSRTLRDESCFTPLGFRIPYEKMSAALRAPENSESSYWQYSLYRGPNGAQQVVKVHYCKTKDAMESVSQVFANEKVLGFDIEWVANSKATSGIKRNVSLIQIASEERVALFHIARFADDGTADGLVAPTFRRIMESPDILKVGVAILGDSTRLRNYLNISCRGLCELSFLHKIVKYHSHQPVQMNRYPVPLAQQVQEHLGLPLLKDQVQTSDWSKELDYDQTRYAASDPYACIQLFYCLEAKRLALNPVPDRPAFAELKQSIVVKKLPVTTDSDDDYSDSSNESFVTCIEDSSDEQIDSIADDFGLVNVQDSDLSYHSSDTDDEHQANISDPLTAAHLPLKKVDQASDWAAAYRKSQTTGFKIPLANLRAYYLWHHHQLELPEIADALRTPPLKCVTVLDYVCEAVYRGSLPADPERFAQMSTHGVQPYKGCHIKMLQAAKMEIERRKESEMKDLDEAPHAIWWKKVDE